MPKMLLYGGENYSDVPLDDNSPGHLEEYEELKAAIEADVAEAQKKEQAPD